jgi:diphthine synthase
MTFYLIGLGLEVDSLSVKAKEEILGCKKVYLENYTVDFPYEIDKLESVIGISVEPFEREDVEGEEFLNEAKEKDIALLVYGDCLSATTHTQLILKCKRLGIDYKIYHNASILSAVANTGLSLYKFGKVCSMPRWKKNYEPISFLDYYLENKSINSHTLILTDIGLGIDEAIYQLEVACNRQGIEIEKIIVISRAGLDDEEIYYETKDILKLKDIKMPYCMIIPGELHFIEKEALYNFSENLVDSI